MHTYIKAAYIVDPASKWHQKTVDLLIENDTISAINPSEIPSNAKVLEANDIHCSPSWFDMRVYSGEPGEEYREDLESLRNALLMGGFGTGLLMPNTKPVIQNKSDVKNILSRNTNEAAQLAVAASVTTNCDGENLNEILDVQNAGAIAFTDGSNPLWNSDILVKTLQYLQKFEGLLINLPLDHKLSLFGQMNEGIVSTGLGLKGIPHLAEELIIQRDLELLQYAGGKIHFSCLSSAKSVELIRKAKADGLQVSCDVSIYHLIFTDELLETFDTNYKVLPPLRTEKDKNALIEGINDGTIDAIVSNHQPFDQDHKKMEFDLASFGIMGTQLVYAIYESHLAEKISLETFIQCISSQPKSILKLKHNTIEEGENASLTLFSRTAAWQFNEENNPSKSDNSPFMQNQFKGKPLGVINNGIHFIDPKFI